MMAVLKATHEPMRKTQLLYKTAMNHEQLTRCLDLLLRHGMVERTEKPFEVYVINDNGRALLGLFEMSAADVEE
jgi:predicted transcriptional regulator